MTRYATLQDVGRAVAPFLPLANPILPATITTDLGLVNGTPQVLVSVGDATRQAIYACPNAIQLGNCFVVGMSADRTSPLVVIASNFQVPVASAGGYGAGGYGSNGYGA